jgi:kynureninase
MEAGIERIRRKSLQLTRYLMDWIEEELGDDGFSLANPKEEGRRGGHVALVHPDAVRICRALKEADVVPDYRPPEIIRLAPVALYTSFSDCHEALSRLKTIMKEQAYYRYPGGRGLVA